jgi:hypothetical protein
LFRYRIEHFLLGADAMVVSTIGHRGFLDFTVGGIVNSCVLRILD